MSLRALPALAPIILLAACGAPGELAGPSREIPPPTASHPSAVSDKHLSAALIGADADRLTTLFGKPRLDIREGPARKLQWIGGGCVLDAYLYPPEKVAGPATATYFDARSEEGRDHDRDQCMAALRKAIRQP